VTGGLPRDRLSAAAEALVVALAIAGDDEAYGELVRRRQSQVRQLLRRLSRDPALADDLAQQAFVQAWRTIRTLKAPGAFGAWLRKLAVNVWLQHVRARGVRERSAADSSLPAATDEPATAEQVDLDRALALLAPDVRLCIVLAYGERMSHREVSAATGLPLGTVKSHITRGAARLREILRAYG
jgi:RNA polymerase sigma-70 factor, ECF subfamily